MSEKNILENTVPTRIYVTTYKKGYMIGNYQWAFDGELPEAVQKAKVQLEKRHLKHLHTVPFLIDLDDDSNGPQPPNSQ